MEVGLWSRRYVESESVRLGIGCYNMHLSLCRLDERPELYEDNHSDVEACQKRCGNFSTLEVDV